MEKDELKIVFKNMDNLIYSIGLTVKTKRSEKEMTQQDLAFKMDADKSCICNLETGNCNNLTLLKLMKLSFVLGIEIAELIKTHSNEK